MSKRNAFLAAISVAAVTLGSCGGGGSGGAGAGAAARVSTATPAPAPLPAPTSALPPTPTPTSVPPSTLAGGALNARVGLKQLAEFPTLSWLYRPEVAGDANGADLVQFGHDSARNLSVATVPGYPRGGLMEFVTETTDDLSFSHVDPAFGAASFFDRGLAMLLLVPGLQNRIFPLEFTSLGWIGWQGIATAPEDKLNGVLVYGVPTAVGDLPTNGMGNYQLYGYDVRRAAGALGQATYNNVRGAVQVDFGTRQFRGDFVSGAQVDRFAFDQVEVAADGGFTGTLAVPGLAGPARIEGRFTGPQGREFMLRWQGPYRSATTGVTETAFGVLAGRRS